MNENKLRRIVIGGTFVCMAALAGMTVHTLHQVSSVRTPELTDAVVAGKRVWQSKNCNDCHTILGIGGYYAPDLTDVARRRGEQWLTSWLTNPQAMRPKTTMPHQRLTPEQVSNLVAFATWVGQVDTNGWPPQPLTTAGQTTPVVAIGGRPVPPRVAALMQKGDCGSCHVVPGIPTANGTDAPSLCVTAKSLKAGQIAPEFIQLAITDPDAALTPGYESDVMPDDYDELFSREEIDTLVTFIAGLSCE